MTILRTTILVSRGTMSGGQSIGECLARESGFRYVTREDLTASVNVHGELASRITTSVLKAAHDYQQFSDLRRPYKILMRWALLECVRQGGVAYFGHSGHLLLAGLPRLLRVRVIAPLAMRIQMLMKRRQCTESEARDRVRQVDEERARWARFMYAKNINAPEHYDLCINLEKVSFSGACSMLAHAAAESDFQPTKESLAAIEDTYLSTTAQVALLKDSRTGALDIGATTKLGSLLLSGPYLDDSNVAIVLEIAKRVAGVREVSYEPGYATTFDVRL